MKNERKKKWNKTLGVFLIRKIHMATRWALSTERGEQKQRVIFVRESMICRIKWVNLEVTNLFDIFSFVLLAAFVASVRMENCRAHLGRTIDVTTATVPYFETWRHFAFRLVCVFQIKSSDREEWNCPGIRNTIGARGNCILYFSVIDTVAQS